MAQSYVCAGSIDAARVVALLVERTEAHAGGRRQRKQLQLRARMCVQTPALPRSRPSR